MADQTVIYAPTVAKTNRSPDPAQASASEIVYAAVAPPKTPRLYASRATKKQLGAFADELPRWAGMDVMLISDEDAKRYIRLSQLTGNDTKAAARAFKTIARDIGYPVPSHLNRDAQERMFRAMSVITQKPATYAFDLKDPTQPQGTLCIMGVPDDRSMQNIISTAKANFTSMRLENFKRYTFEHEADHCGNAFPLNGKQDQSILKEAPADQNVLNIERQRSGAAPEGNTETQAFIDWRILNYFHNMDFVHATGPALNMEGQSPDFRLFNQESNTPSDNGLIPASPFEGSAISIVMAKALQSLMRERGVNYLQSVEMFISDPSLMRDSMRKLKDDGAFTDSPLQARYVDQYLEAADRHEPKQADMPPAQSAINRTDRTPPAPKP